MFVAWFPYVSFSEFADKYWNQKSWNRCKTVSDCHQGPSEFWSNVDVICEETAVHSSDTGDTDRHEHYGECSVTTNVAHSYQTQGWDGRSWNFF